MTHPARQPLVVGNWKMNLDEEEAGAVLDRLRDAGLARGRVEVGVAPPFPFLRLALDRLSGSGIHVGVQNHHWQDQGAFTGEVSPKTVAAMGASFAILGHSERRHVMGETDERIGEKVAAAFRNGLLPILCVGETDVERDRGATLAVVEAQLRAGVRNLPDGGGPRVVVAYEPVWAIGTGRRATPEQVAEVHDRLRRQIEEVVGRERAAAARILYGGSVTAANAAEVLALPEVDGALVGGASLDPASFAAIVDAAA